MQASVFCVGAYLCHNKAIRIEATKRRNDANRLSCVGVCLRDNIALRIEATRPNLMQTDVFVLGSVCAIVGP